MWGLIEKLAEKSVGRILRKPTPILFRFVYTNFVEYAIRNDPKYTIKESMSFSFMSFKGV